MPVGVTDVGQAGGAEEDRVGLSAQLDGLAGQILARPPVERRAHLGLLEREVQAAAFHGLEHPRRFFHDLGPNAVATDQRDAVVGHLTQPSPRR